MGSIHNRFYLVIKHFGRIVRATIVRTAAAGNKDFYKICPYADLFSYHLTAGIGSVTDRDRNTPARNENPRARNTALIDPVAHTEHRWTP